MLSKENVAWGSTCNSVGTKIKKITAKKFFYKIRNKIGWSNSRLVRGQCNIFNTRVSRFQQ
jgi:hypothetical protein